MTAPHVIRVAQAIAAGDNTIAAWIERHGCTRTQAYDAVRVMRKHDVVRAQKSYRAQPAKYHLTRHIDQVMHTLQVPQDNAPFAIDGRWDHQALMQAWPLDLPLPPSERIRIVTRA